MTNKENVLHPRVKKTLDHLLLTEKERKNLPRIVVTNLNLQPDFKGDSGVYINEDVILLDRETGDETTLGHELGHYYSNQPKYFDTFKEYLRGEIEANLWVYKRLNKPRHLTPRIRNYLNVAMNTYDIKLQRA